MSKKNEPALSHKNGAANPSSLVKESTDLKIFSIVLITVLMAGIARNGQFQESNYLNGIIILGCLGILFWGWNVFAKQEIHVRNLPVLLGFGFVLAYGMSLISAVYTRTAVLSLSKYLGVLILILLIQNLKDRVPFAEWFLKGYYMAGMVLAVLGLDGIFGSRLIALLQSVADIASSEGGREFLNNMLVDKGRVGSLFHYPNTTASFLLVAWIIGITLWFRAEKLHTKILIGSGTGLMGAAFVLTLSRGAYLMAVPVLVLAFLLLTKDHRPLFTAGLLGTLITAVLLGIGFWPGAETRSMGVMGWGVALLVAGLISVAMNALRSKLAGLGQRTQDAETDGPKQRKSKKIWMVVLLGGFLLALTIMSIAWFWMVPIRLSADGDVSLNRLFSLDKPGAYTLDIEFAEPPDQATLEQLRISLIAQTPKEMFLGASQALIDLSLQEARYEAPNQYKIPFRLSEAQLVTENLTLQGRMGADNQITHLAIADSQSKDIVRSLRLSRKLISDSVSDRIESLFMLRSAFKRFSFYGDALEMFKDRPLTGGGGGAWEHLYFSYQDYQYITTDVHSYAFQILVETGMFGAFMLLALIAALAYQLIDLWRRPDVNQMLLWLGAVVLLGHSLIDFDFAYYSVLLIFWAFIALMDYPYPKAKRESIPALRWPVYLLCLALILGSIHWPFRVQTAKKYAEKYTAAASDKKAAAAEQSIRGAIALDPLTADYKVALASLLVLRSKVTKEGYGEGNQLAAEARTQADHYFVALEKLSDYYIKSVQWEKAYEVETRITAIKPLIPLTWEAKGQMIQNAIQWYRQTDKVDETQRQTQLALWLDRGLALPAEMESASASKIEAVTPTPELKALLEAWAAKKADLTSQ